MIAISMLHQVNLYNFQYKLVIPPIFYLDYFVRVLLTSTVYLSASMFIYILRVPRKLLKYIPKYLYMFVWKFKQHSYPLKTSLHITRMSWDNLSRCKVARKVERVGNLVLVWPISVIR